jgi:hypothetical protein
VQRAVKTIVRKAAAFQRLRAPGSLGCRHRARLPRRERLSTLE